jgi:hypothetical protein
MFRSLSPRWRRLINSVAYGALVLLVVGLGYLTLRAINERRHGAESTEQNAESAILPLVDISNFSARRERTSDEERLSVSLRLRLTAPGTVDCFVYVLARNDRVSPKLWGVWPTQGTAGAVTAGGHFGATNPASGSAVTLTPSWSRIIASIDHTLGQPPFETVMVYVVSPKGEILLSRPFAL